MLKILIAILVVISLFSNVNAIDIGDYQNEAQCAIGCVKNAPNYSYECANWSFPSCRDLLKKCAIECAEAYENAR
ncbi:hypothetical protein DDB_G0273183 [Dictyostelium discoideum AX4]|uniref:Uncharacterized protein n=1 Tax=Dictyostelium discoideum TaxID=44689 RepID=Q556V3_DICDI|nr:hypothetical protein DDB_G0273799 [Dictyostelium discoideum AX4]XP_644734.1 hypothetical protein DDB_G0273183 [Dictyostelium discoideum AX4]EAL70590.1 hypothetical protein DDB_G0273799 [Dictyostelium discoideum AX4]EAL70809.1 hypothetical protein DDB_G0273183 [Dictyostelium discoideum AX4]|eukprot:XP_644516.1 hypothetical protein DDB_G0273799 [Dictyostelium discoideum AX4]